MRNVAPFFVAILGLFLLVFLGGGLSQHSLSVDYLHLSLIHLAHYFHKISTPKFTPASLVRAPILVTIALTVESALRKQIFTLSFSAFLGQVFPPVSKLVHTYHAVTTLPRVNSAKPNAMGAFPLLVL